MAMTTLGSIALVALTGCAPAPVACPAVGWANILTVEVTGRTSSVHSVQLCTEDGCAPRLDVESGGSLGLVRVADREGDRWTFETGMLPLDEVTIRSADANGSIISKTSVSPDWKRVVGSERCGGPSKAFVSVDI
jgi:hypothetical protein